MKTAVINEINQTIYQYLSERPVLKQDTVLQEMLYYSLGFRKDGTLLESGKRLRPLFCCLTCGAVSGDHHPALMYGAALEMLHNYTLVHDDIEDKSDTRHNRPTLWKKWGTALAINAGDLLYETALSAALEADLINGKNGLHRMMSMSEALYLGQHRDISFEDRIDISEDEYIEMIKGKTSALLGCSFALGALAGGADPEAVSAYERAGHLLGLAFQIRDDYLGTWGDSEKLGKSVCADIMDKKNTLAVVYTAANDPDFLDKWQEYDGNPEGVAIFADIMEKAGAPEYLSEQCIRYTKEADSVLSAFRAENDYQKLLDAVTASLADRMK